MKKIILSLAVITSLSLLFFSACKKGKEVLSPENKQKRSEQSRSTAHRGGEAGGAEVQDFFAAYGPQYEAFTIDPETETTIQLSGGTKITIPAGAYTIDGSPVRQLINFEAIEFTNRGSMALRGINTMAGDKLLYSDGSLDIRVTAGDDRIPVDETVASGKAISFLVPDRPGGLSYTNLYDAGITETKTEDGIVQQQFDWIPFSAEMQADVRPNDGNFGFQGLITNGKNCDVWLYPVAAGTARQSRAPQFTTLQVNIPNNPGVFGGYQGSGGNTYVLFIPKGYNSIAQLYNNATGTQVESAPNSIPVGMSGRVLAYSIVGGNYYRASRDIVTSGPTQSVTLDLIPSDAAELVAVLNALSSY